MTLPARLLLFAFAVALTWIPGRALPAAWSPQSWLGKTPLPQLEAISDADEETVCAVPVGRDFGLESASPQRIGRLVVRYVSLYGYFLQPQPAAAPLEIWSNNRWQRVPAQIEIDYSRWRELAPYQGLGTITWTYRFPAVETTRVRVVVQQCEKPLRWFMSLTFRGVLVRSVEVSGGTAAGSPGDAPSVREIARPQPFVMATSDPSGQRLTDPVYRPRRQATGDGIEIQWPRPRMVSLVRIPPDSKAGPSKITVQWFDGQRLRPVESPSLSRVESGEAGSWELRFLPVTTTRLQVQGAVDADGVEVFLDRDGQKYHDSARDSARDVLGDRALAQGEPDWPAVAGLILPLDFLKGYIGRPDDISESLLTCDGKLVMRVGDGPARAHPIDRSLALAIDGRVVGETPEEIGRGLVDRWMPGVTYEIARDDVAGEMTVFTTAPTDPIYADRVHCVLRPTARRARQPIRLDVVFGAKTTMYWYYEKNKTAPPTPLTFAPQAPGFRLGSDGRCVLDREGKIVLYSTRAGTWAGTAREPCLRIELAPIAGVAELDLIVPHPGQPSPRAEQLAASPYADSLAKFRRYWTEQVARGSQFTVPEPAVNDAVRNALCQCLIVPDEQVPFYGSYWYEWCIGLEEWWPTIGLAQFGRPEARIHAAAIAALYLTDTSHHFPYRNGLAGMGAAEVALLSGDLDWYRKLVPNLKQRAEWTIRSAAEDNRGTPYAGLIKKFAYGGDVHAPAHSLYNNATCWRGLRDTGRMLKLLGDEATGSRYLAAAEALRRRVVEVWEPLVDKTTTPPFVPMGFDIGEKGKGDSYVGQYHFREQSYPLLSRVNLGNYWNLFMQMLLEFQFFPPGRPETGWIRDYCQQHAGTVVGLARFRNGPDWHYGAGYIKSLLWSGRREEFLLSFYGALAHGAATDVRSSPEDCPIWPARTSNEAFRDEYDAARWTWQSGWDEPLSAGPGVILQMLRMMLVDEREDDSGASASLVLLSGIPRRWLENGKEIHVTRAPTRFGDLGFNVVSQANAGRIEMTLDWTPRQPLRELVIKLFHPQGRALRGATVNGQEIPARDAQTLVIPALRKGRSTIVAHF